MWQLPKGERQSFGYDTNACGIFSVLNCIESCLIKYNLPELKYLDNISDRYTSAMIGGLNGNLPTEVIESIKINGLLPENILPFGGKNQTEYYSKSVITSDMVSNAKKVLDILDISYEYVNFGLGKESSVKEALKSTPLVGVITNPNGTTHAVMIFNETQYFDSYEPYIKKLYYKRLHYAIKVIVKIKKPMRTAILTRQKSDDKQTLGELKCYNGNNEFTCKTLELAWKDNQRNISCIPTGNYKVKKTYSLKFGTVYEVKDVKNRSGIYIHHGNYFSDIQGCILVGNRFSDINADGKLDVINSKVTRKALENFFGFEDFILIVK